GVRFAHARGLRVALREARFLLDVMSVDGRKLDALAEEEHPPYRLVAWVDAAPDDLLPSYAAAKRAIHDGSGLLEKEINLAVARHLHRYLAQRGAKVYLTRNKDTDLSHLETVPRTRQGRDLLARARLAHRYGAEAFISLHVNFSRNRQERGGIAFYQRDSAKSRLLAALIQEELKRVQPENRQTILWGNFFLLRHAPEPAVLVEMGFLSHPVERRLLREPEYWRLLAEAIGRGVERYFLGREGNPP
ncbi:MAG: N-acetylmuramoyl-L-alanine amidase, partial [Bacillota bacterium]|nr:N-acetylmuramoyl-L-alanine amidase [Bacillota bacterium]